MAAFQLPLLESLTLATQLGPAGAAARAVAAAQRPAHRPVRDLRRAALAHDLADVVGPSLTTLWISNAARLENLDP